MRLQPFAVTVIGLSALGSAHASLKSEIEALNKPIKVAFMKRNIDGFSKIIQSHMTSDFICTEGDTTMNFDQKVGRIRLSYSMYSKMTGVSLQVLSVKEHGATGSTIERRTTEGIAKGLDRRTHTTAIVTVSTGTYRRVNGQWKMATMPMGTGKLTVDGKPMPTGGGKHPH